MTTTVAAPEPARAADTAIQRQFVNFQFFRVDRAFRRETAEIKTDAKREFAKIVPGKKPYLFVYPFVKTRDWYLLPQSERQRIMNEHIAIGHKYPRVKINTTYSFGLDDQDFVVAFESESAAEFLDLVQDLRET